MTIDKVYDIINKSGKKWGKTMGLIDFFRRDKKQRYSTIYQGESFMKAEFIDQDNSIAIDNFVFNANELRRGNPYNTTFFIFVTSGSFSGCGECECNIKEFKQFVYELQEMYDFKRNSVAFKDICYGSEIVFTIGKLGSIEVKGTVYADGMLHSLTFCFNTDQSVFLPFVRGLKKLVENADI